MTIRFVTAWNGYHADQIVSGLGTTEETRLIGLKFAVADLDGPGNTPTPVGAITDPVTGGLEKLLVAGKAVPIPGNQLSNVLAWSLGGFLAAPVAVGSSFPYSMMLQTVLEAEFDSIQVGIFNASTASVAGVKVAVGAGTTLGLGNGQLGLTAGQPTGSSFVQATFGGAATGTLTASPANSTGAVGVNIGGSNCSITWTDPVVCSSLPRADGTSGLPCVNILLAYPINVNRTVLSLDGTNLVNEGSNTVSPYNRPARVYTMATQAVDFVGSPAYAQPSNSFGVRNYSEFPPIIIKYSLRNGYGKTLIVYGDSIAEGTGASIQNIGWHREFQNMMSAPSAPISICNLAAAGTQMASWSKRITSTLASFPRGYVYIPSHTPNNLEPASEPQMAASIMIGRADFGGMRAKIDSPNYNLITSTVLPTNYSAKPYGTLDSYRVAWNNYIRDTGFQFADFDLAGSSAAVDINGQFTMLSSADNIHPDTAEYKRMATAFLSAWV